MYEFHCETPELAKHTRVSFPISNKRSSHPFHLIHSDIWGPSTIPIVFGACWFVSLIDDCTRVTWIFFLKQKSDVSIVIPNFHSMVQNQFRVQIKALGQIMLEITSTRFFHLIFNHGAFSMTHYVLTYPNKMG